MPGRPASDTDKQKSSYQQELERRANDLLRIYNPFEERYVVEWDRKGGTKLFPIESKGEAVYPRYIAEKYLKEAYQKILNNRARDAILKENERRIEGGLAEMDKTMKTNEQMGFEEKFYNPSEEDAQKVIALLYLGVESEHGVDRESPLGETKADTRPTFDRALEDVQEGKVPKDTEESPQVATGEATVQAKEEFGCEVCDFVAKNNAGLISHKRTHRKELEQKKEEAVSEVSK